MGLKMRRWISNWKGGEECFDLLGTNIQMMEYEGLGHWYSEDMLRRYLRVHQEKVQD